MINPFADVNWRPHREDCRAFANSLIVGFPAIALTLAALIRWKSGEWVNWPWLIGGAGFALGIACWSAPVIARPVYLIWNAVGGAIGFVISNLFLVLTFYLVVTPVGLLLRCLGKDPLERRIDLEAKSYWKNAEKSVDPDRYFRQF